MSKSKILFMLTGSIAAFKACQVISRLVQDGHEVQTVTSLSALKFIGPATLEGLTGRKVLTDVFEDGRAMDHIHLTRWADVALLCPATAAAVARLSHGLSDDLIGALALAWPSEKPFHIFPAMNAQMLANPATVANLKILNERGYKVHGTSAGNLACGEEGEGRLLDPEEILQQILPSAKGKILITSGATREPLDGIRFISNVSTGQTGATLGDRLQMIGWDVTYLHADGALMMRHASELYRFSSFTDLRDQLKTLLGLNDYAGIIHCAAVSDYSVAAINGEAPDAAIKTKTGQELTVQLKANPKLLPLLKEYARHKDIKVIGFKLTLNQNESAQIEAAREILQPGVDAIVCNDWSQVNNDRRRHPGSLVLGQHSVPFMTLDELAVNLNQFLCKGEDRGPLS